MSLITPVYKNKGNPKDLHARNAKYWKKKLFNNNYVKDRYHLLKNQVGFQHSDSIHFNQHTGI